MPRPIWKGDLSFGLVTIPVGMYTATRRDELRFRQLDRRDLTPVHEKRVSESGREVPWEDIVKGYEYESGSFVVLEPDDFKRANVEASQTIDIVQAVPAEVIEPPLYEQPYYLVPTKSGRKPYHLLRETLARSGRLAVAT